MSMNIDEILERLRRELDVRKLLEKDKNRDKSGKTRIEKRQPADGTFKVLMPNGSTKRGIKTSNGGTTTDQIVRGIEGDGGFWGLDWKNKTENESLETQKLTQEILIAYKYKLVSYLSILFKVVKENDPTPCTCSTYKRVGNRCHPVCDGTGTALEECLAKEEPQWPTSSKQPKPPEPIDAGGVFRVWVGHSLGVAQWSLDPPDAGKPQVAGSLWITDQYLLCNRGLEDPTRIFSNCLDEGPNFWESYFSTTNYYTNRSISYYGCVPGFIAKSPDHYSPYIIAAGLTGSNYVIAYGTKWIFRRYPVFLFPPGTPIETIDAIYNTGDLNALANISSIVGVAYSATTFTRDANDLAYPPMGGAWSLQSRTDDARCSPFLSDPYCTDPGKGNSPVTCPFPLEKRSITYYLGGSKKKPCECIKFNYLDSHKLYFSAIDGYGEGEDLTSVEIIRILCGTRKAEGLTYYCKQIDIRIEGDEIKKNTISYPTDFEILPEDWRKSLLNSQLSWAQSVTLPDTGKPYLDENRYKTNVNIIENATEEIHHLIKFDNQQKIDNVPFLSLINNIIEERKVILDLSQFIGNTKETDEPVKFKIGKVYGLVDSSQDITNSNYEIVGYSGFIANVNRIKIDNDGEGDISYTSPLYCRSSQKPAKEIVLAESLIFLSWDFIISLVKDKFIVGVVNGIDPGKEEFVEMSIAIVQQGRRSKNTIYQNPKLPLPNKANPEDSFFQSYKVEFDVPNECYTEWLMKDGVTFLQKAGNKYSILFVDFDQRLPLGKPLIEQKKLREFLLTYKGKIKAEIEQITLQFQGEACLILKRNKKKVALFGLGLTEEKAKEIEIIDIVANLV